MSMPQQPTPQPLSTSRNENENKNHDQNLTHQTTRLHFTPLCLNDTLALHELRTEPDVIKWSRQKVPDKSLKETENWIRRMTDEPLINELESTSSSGDAEGKAEAGTEKKPDLARGDSSQSATSMLRIDKGNSDVKKDRTKTGLVFAVRELSHVQAMNSKQEGAGAGAGAEVPDKIIATVGIRATESPLSNKLQFEIGYMFVPRTWGKGYASEAVRGVVRWWFTFLRGHGQGQSGAGVGGEGSRSKEGEEGEDEGEVEDKDRVYAIVSKGNPASLRVMEKCGFRNVAEGVDGDESTEVVELCISSSEI
ncbi:GNAT family N-acetyltransferase [Aspergillus undulatus]|uniref:GNAT family N-acetyltransferase n=1 Tax=Aspergillus undulatus TaxID=1810928 RepID=UPI003CCD6C4C